MLLRVLGISCSLDLRKYFRGLLLLSWLFLLIIILWAAFPSWWLSAANLPPIPDSLRLQGRRVESHILMLKGPSLSELPRPRGMYLRGKICSCWHVGYTPPDFPRTTFMSSGSEITVLNMFTHRKWTGVHENFSILFRSCCCFYSFATVTRAKNKKQQQLCFKVKCLR